MSPGFTARSRAESFDDLLQRGPDGPPGTTRQRTWLDLVEQLRATPAPPARPGFVDGLRGRLMKAAVSELTTGAVSSASASTTTPPVGPAREDRLALRPRRTRRERRVVAALAAMAVVGAGAGAAYASQRALPGDALYPLKRAIENVELSAETQPRQRAQGLLSHADARLSEVEALRRRGDLDAAVVRTTLSSFSEQAVAGSDLVVAGLGGGGDDGAVRGLRSFTAQGMDTLDGLEPAVPAAARPALVDAARTVHQIDDTARRLCTCGGPVVPLPPELLLESIPLPDGALDGVPGRSDGAARPGQDGSADTGRGSDPAPGAGTASTGSGAPDGRGDPADGRGQGRRGARDGQGARAGQGATGRSPAATPDLPGAADLVETLESLTDELSDLPGKLAGTAGAGDASGAGSSAGSQQGSSRPQRGSDGGSRAGRGPGNGPLQGSDRPGGSGQGSGGLQHLGDSVDDAIDELAAGLLP